MRKPVIAVAAGAGMLASVAVGALAFGPTLAGAQSDTTTTTDTTESRAATRLAEVLAPLVTDGTITQAQADAVIDAIEAARPMGGHGSGHHGMRGGVHLDAAATALGLDAEELRDRLVAGETLAEVAAAEGVTVDALVAAIVADIVEELDAKVASGDIDQARADEVEATLTDRVTAMVNGEGGFAGHGGPMGGFGGHMGGRGHHGPFADVDGDDSDDATATGTSA